MRVLLVSNLYPIIGTSGRRFVEDRVKAHRSMGIEIDPIALMPARGALENFLNMVLARSGTELEAPTVFRRGPVPLSLARKVGILKYGLGGERSSRLAADSLNSRHTRMYDLLHAHGMYGLKAGSVARHLAAKLQIPYVVTYHGGDVHSIRRNEYPEWRRTVRGAQANIFVSRALAQSAQTLIGPVPHPVVIPNGFNPNIFRLSEISEDAALGSHQVLFVGRLSVEKGADRLSAIFRALHQRLPRITFGIVGDGPLGNVLVSSCQGVPVTFYGNQTHERVSILMRNSEVLLMPSRSEGAPTVIMEAHACGMQVVGTAVGGTPELVHDRSLLAQPIEASAVDSLVQLTFDALASPVPQSMLAQHAAPYTWDAIAGREASVYRDVLNAQRDEP